ncbi:MAG: AMP-binding protein [Cyanobacteria bacterium SZAS LIN-3]|nr:AMP-binding protein [Cyanobacteria bacterium SZAS LIN-3]
MESTYEDTLQTIIEGLPARATQPALLAFDVDGLQTWTYEQLYAEIVLLSGGLLTRLSPGDHEIVIIAPPGPHWVIACLAAVRAGLVVAPLDHQTDPKILADVLADLTNPVIFTTLATRTRLSDCLEKYDRAVYLLDCDKEHSWKRLFVADGACKTRMPADFAAVFYTSGTMGPPKGVPLSHRNLAFQIKSVQAAGLLNDEDRLFAPLPLHHIYPFVVEMLLPLALGLPVIFPASLTGPELIRAMHEGEATAIVGVPRLYAALFAAIKERFQASKLTAMLFEGLLTLSKVACRVGHLRIGRLLFAPLHARMGPRLRLLASGGAALDPPLAANLEGLGWPIVIGYGLTETSPLLTIKFPDRSKAGSVGKAIPGVELRIADGEIQARGPGIFAGYRNLPEKTAATFAADGWFKTGDCGYFVGDDLFVLGRSSVLIVGEAGEKIDPEQLEQFYGANPLIKEIAVFQRNSKLAAVVVPNMVEVNKLGGGDVNRLMHDAVDERSVHLPRYKRLSAIVVSSEPIARTPMGKVQRYKLAKSFDLLRANPARQTSLSWQEMQEQDRELFACPMAQAAWQFLIGRFDGQRVNLSDSLQLDLGIDSLEWIALTMDMREKLGVELSEAAIMQLSTVRDLLVQVVEAGDASVARSCEDPFVEPEKSLSAEQARWLRPLNPAQQAAQHFLYFVDKCLVNLLFRPRIEGLSALPVGGSLLFVPNHASYLDGFVLAGALPYGFLQSLQWAGWTGLSFQNWFTRSLSRVMRGIPIDPDKAVLSSLALGASVLKRGQSLVWFPEGRRTLTGELQPFKGGVAILLEHCPDTLVVPVYLNNTAQALAPGEWLIKPVRLDVIFGQPRRVADLIACGAGATPRERLLSSLQNAVRELRPGQSGEQLTVRSHGL